MSGVKSTRFYALGYVRTNLVEKDQAVEVVVIAPEHAPKFRRSLVMLSPVESGGPIRRKFLVKTAALMRAVW